MGRRYKIADVAKYAGVSKSAVSAVLNNRVGEGIRVSEETQQKIRDAVQTLGYVPSIAARNLARGRNNLLAVFTFEGLFPIDSRNFYYPFLMGIEEEAAQQGYDLLLATAARDAESRGRIYRKGANRLQLADGGILLGQSPDKQEIAQLLEDRFPFVYVGRRDSLHDNISYAAADYAEATQTLTIYMLRHQHQRLAYLASPLQNEAAQDRYVGFVHAHIASHVPLDETLLWRGTADVFTAEDFEAFLNRGVTGFIIENDQIALRVLEIASQLGKQCPKDFSLGVLGDPLSMVENHYTWTTFKIPRREMGREAVRLLIRMLSSDSVDSLPYRTVLPCQFEPGNTIANPPGLK
jgi:LacI family transcriptional regulator